MSEKSCPAKVNEGKIRASFAFLQRRHLEIPHKAKQVSFCFHIILRQIFFFNSETCFGCDRIATLSSHACSWPRFCQLFANSEPPLRYEGSSALVSATRTLMELLYQVSFRVLFQRSFEFLKQFLNKYELQVIWNSCRIV